MAPYIQQYEARKQSGEEWPGYLEDATPFWDKTNPLTAKLPHKLNHLDTDILDRVLKRHGFEVEYIQFMDIRNYIPEDVHLNGKETVGAVSKKSYAVK
jgi:hypothetical protein